MNILFLESENKKYYNKQKVIYPPEIKNENKLLEIIP